MSQQSKFGKCFFFYKNDLFVIDAAYLAQECYCKKLENFFMIFLTKNFSFLRQGNPAGFCQMIGMCPSTDDEVETFETLLLNILKSHPKIVALASSEV